MKKLPNYRIPNHDNILEKIANTNLLELFLFISTSKQVANQNLRYDKIRPQTTLNWQLKQE